MTFQLSPGVVVTETDLTNVIPTVATSIGAFVGVFQWGPILDVTSVDYQGSLTKNFGRPNDDTATSFFSAANFLDYTNQLKVVRVAGANAKNATENGSGLLIKNMADYEANYQGGYTAQSTVTVAITNAAGSTTATLDDASKVKVGSYFTSLDAYVTAINPSNDVTVAITNVANSTTATLDDASKVKVGSYIQSLDAYVITINLTDNTIGLSKAIVAANTATSIQVTNFIATPNTIVLDKDIAAANTATSIQVTNFDKGCQFAARYAGTMGNSIQIVMADKNTFDTWAYKANFSNSPNVGESENDELHILIIDAGGKLTGTKGAILEKYAFVSKAFDSKSSDGTNNYYKDVLTKSSRFVYWLNHPDNTNWGAPKGTTFTNLTSPMNVTLSGGVDDNDITLDSALIEGWQLFSDAESVDINLPFAGPASATVAKYVIQNVAEVRMDCVAFVSPSRESCVNNPNAMEDVIAWRNNAAFNVNSSYGAMDSGWKYQYDQYNDTYRWIPLNADMAGLHARTDYTNDPWWAAGGLMRGQIKNVVKLSWSPNQMARDQLYQAGINPVTSFQGQGTALFGNKTLLAKPSAFDRINVRRLFITIEKAISRAARYAIFEFNDPFTRAQLKAMIEPYLRMVQGRRGIQKFQVIIDETVNTEYIISTNQLVGAIKIMPNYTAEFITLNFIAVNNTAMFTEQG